VLTVNPAPVAPSITVQPKAQTVTAGQNVTFSVTATGMPPLLYQWYKNGVPILGATLSSYTLTNVQATGAGTYTVMVSDGTLPNATSSGAVLTVNVPPSITVQPKSDTVTAGQSDTFSVTATGTAPLSYQWYKNGAPISGAKSSSYILPKVQASDSGTYTVTVSNVTLLNATSSQAVLKVNVPPSITVQPKSDTVTAGQSDTFNVTATGTAPLSYQWYKNGAPISGAKSSSYILPKVQASDSGTYTVTVSNVTLLNATSNPAVLTVNPAPVAPSISAQPQPQTVTAGQSATFSVTATGTQPLSYHWYKGVTPVGENSPSFSIVSVQASDAGTYSVTVSNGTSPDAVSNGVLLTVNPAPIAPSISAQPQSQTIVAGLSATFSVTASGTAPLTYQWTKDGAPVSGATSSSYSISDVQAANVGTYQVIVTSAALLSDTSNGAILTVTPAAPSITTQPLSQTVSTGQNVTFSVVAIGTEPFTYTWFKDGTEIPSATLSSYSIAGAQTTDMGTYTVTVSNGISTNAMSDDALLTVTTP
jgi:hypothetical protein